MKETDLLTIKAFAEFTGIRQSILRYYDEIGLLTPAMRGENGYRYYAPTQIVTANLIRVLSHLNTPLKEISQQERGRTPESILELLGRQERRLDAEMRRLQEAYSVTHTFRRLIQTGLEEETGQIEERRLEPMPVTLWPENRFRAGDTFYEEFIKHCEQAKRLRINLHYPVAGFYGSMEAFARSPGQPTRFFSVDPYGRDIMAGGRCLVGYERGYYGERAADVCDRLRLYAQEHGLAFAGPVYELYLLDEISERDPRRYLARFSVRVKPSEGT